MPGVERRSWGAIRSDTIRYDKIRYDTIRWGGCGPDRSGSGSGSGSNPPSMGQESGIEKITDGLYLYNPAKFLGDYQAQMQQGSSSGGGLKGLVKNAAGSLISYGISKALPLAFACDMRLKTDVSPLETTDVNDDLAEMAFFVKGLRECA